MVKEFNDARRFRQTGAGERRTYKRQGQKKVQEFESDAHRLAQRAKQIMYGENTPGYAHFMKALELYPELFKGCIPVKPAVMQKCSKRSWDGQIRKWRRALHMYDFVDFEDGEQGRRTTHLRHGLRACNTREEEYLSGRTPVNATPSPANTFVAYLAEDGGTLTPGLPEAHTQPQQHLTRTQLMLGSCQTASKCPPLPLQPYENESPASGCDSSSGPALHGAISGEQAGAGSEDRIQAGDQPAPPPHPSSKP